MQLKVGDLVQCRETHYARGLGIVGRIGMAAELRRKDLRILFSADNQHIWLPKREVNRIILPPPSGDPSLLDRLSWLIHFVHATECELEPAGHARYVFTVRCGPVSLEELLHVREYMSPVLLRMQVLPGGMSRLSLQITLDLEPKQTQEP